MIEKMPSSNTTSNTTTTTITTTSSVTILSKSVVCPSKPSSMPDLKLSVSDLPMLSCHYIQKGGLFTRPPFTSSVLISMIRDGLSVALSHFPALAGRLITDEYGYVFIACNDLGVDFIHACANNVTLKHVLSPPDVPDVVKGFFTYDRTVSYKGHFQPIMAVQVTELADGVFISCCVNHSVTDGTSFWNFFNTFAEVTRGVCEVTKPADFTRDSVLISSAVLKLPEGGPAVTFNENEPLRERIFSFTHSAISELKARVNKRIKFNEDNSKIATVELYGKHINDPWSENKESDRVAGRKGNWKRNVSNEISSFQSLSALLWRCVTRARKLNPEKKTTFRMAVNCRHRLEPKLQPLYFGNAIQSIPTVASVEELMRNDLRWAAEQLNKNVRDHWNDTVRKNVADWESNPRCFPLGNFDGAMITMGSSPRFPMYDNDFGWGRPVAVRSGRANKFDGKISAFPGRYGGGNVDLEVVLAPDTMSALESDPEWMHFASHLDYLDLY